MHRTRFPLPYHQPRLRGSKNDLIVHSNIAEQTEKYYRRANTSEPSPPCPSQARLWSLTHQLNNVKLLTLRLQEHTYEAGLQYSVKSLGASYPLLCLFPQATTGHLSASYSFSAPSPCPTPCFRRGQQGPPRVRFDGWRGLVRSTSLSCHERCFLLAPLTTP